MESKLPGRLRSLGLLPDLHRQEKRHVRVFRPRAGRLPSSLRNSHNKTEKEVAGREDSPVFRLKLIDQPQPIG